MMQPISSEMQSFIASLPETTRVKLAVRRAQVLASESGNTAQIVNTIRAGEICYEAALAEFGEQTAKTLFELANLKVI